MSFRSRNDIVLTLFLLVNTAGAFYFLGGDSTLILYLFRNNRWIEYICCIVILFLLFIIVPALNGLVSRDIKTALVFLTLKNLNPGVECFLNCVIRIKELMLKN